MHQHGGKDDDATGRKIAHFSECEKNYRSESGGKEMGRAMGVRQDRGNLKASRLKRVPLA